MAGNGAKPDKKKVQDLAMSDIRKAVERLREAGMTENEIRTVLREIIRKIVR